KLDGMREKPAYRRAFHLYFVSGAPGAAGATGAGAGAGVGPTVRGRVFSVVRGASTTARGATIEYTKYPPTTRMSTVSTIGRNPLPSVASALRLASSASRLAMSSRRAMSSGDGSIGRSGSR